MRGGLAARFAANSLPYYQDKSIDDVQYVLYGHRLGLSLPARDPWSCCTPEDIKGEDIPWLDTVFTSALGVSVMERLSAFASHAGGVPAGMPPFAAPPMHARQLRVNDFANVSPDVSEAGTLDNDDEDDERMWSGPLRGGASAFLTTLASFLFQSVIPYAQWPLPTLGTVHVLFSACLDLFVVLSIGGALSAPLRFLWRCVPREVDSFMHSCRGTL